MTSNVARLALPFTDVDLDGFRNVRIKNVSTGASFTIVVDLPSVSGVNGAYYNGGDLGTGNTATWAGFPDESLVMAFAYEISINLDGFALTVTEDPLLPGRYILDRNDGLAWQILWDDAATTMPAEWLGFEQVTISSAVGGAITAPWQADRLWRATRPVWNRRRNHKKTAHAMTWSGDPSKRRLSATRQEWSLRYSAQVGAKVYLYDATLPTLAAEVPGMALGDPNLPLESLWDWIASRGPMEYWADEDTLTESEYVEPRVPDSLETVLRLITGERSGAPPVYDLTLEVVKVA